VGYFKVSDRVKLGIYVCSGSVQTSNSFNPTAFSTSRPLHILGDDVNVLHG
jgi:hypothetical protein